MSRRTYTERRTYSARVMRFRESVYAKHEGLTAGCRVLLLRLSDDMDAKCIVSIPRNQLAAEFGVAPARITEWVKQARELGFLSTVRRGRPGVTATYQGLRVAMPGQSEVREGVPHDDDLGVRETEPLGVREDVPQSEVQRYARAVPQEGVAAAGSGTAPNGDDRDGGSKEEATTDRAPLTADASTTDCPHGMPGGEYPDPFDDLREPSCPACWIEFMHNATQPADKRWTA